MTAKRRLQRLVGLAVLAYLYVPLLLVVLFAFNDSERVGLPMRGLTGRWFGAIAEDAVLLRSIANSAIVAGVTTVISTTVGTLAAFVVVRRRSRWGPLLEMLGLLPLLLPGVVLGIGLFLVASALGVRPSLGTVILGHVALTTPVAMFVVASRLRRMSSVYESAARDLGAGPVQTARHVTFPLIRSAVIGSGLLVFTLSIDEVIVTFLLTGTQNTLPVQVYSMVRFGLSPTVAAVYSIIVAATLVVLIGLGLAGRTRDLLRG